MLRHLGGVTNAFGDCKRAAPRIDTENLEACKGCVRGTGPGQRMVIGELGDHWGFFLLVRSMNFSICTTARECTPSPILEPDESVALTWDWTRRK